MSLTNIEQVLKTHQLRNTKPRRELARILADNHPCHCTAEQLHVWSKNAGLNFNLQTVYNTLNQFVQIGLIRKLNIDSAVAFYDTNLEAHHHLYHPEAQHLVDIPLEMIDTSVNWAQLGMDIDPSQTDIVIRC